MKIENIIVLMICLMTISLSVVGQKIEKSVNGVGGDLIKNDQIQLGITIGQPVIGLVLRDQGTAKLGFWYSALELVTSIEEIGTAEDSKLSMSQNYPNPFMEYTLIDINVPITDFVYLDVYDIQGTLVDRLIHERLFAGAYQVKWEAKGLPAGIYHAQLKYKDKEIVKKLIKVDLINY